MHNLLFTLYYHSIRSPLIDLEQLINLEKLQGLNSKMPIYM